MYNRDLVSVQQLPCHRTTGTLSLYNRDLVTVQQGHCHCTVQQEPTSIMLNGMIIMKMTTMTMMMDGDDHDDDDGDDDDDSCGGRATSCGGCNDYQL